MADITLFKKLNFIYTLIFKTNKQKGILKTKKRIIFRKKAQKFNMQKLLTRLKPQKNPIFNKLNYISVTIIDIYPWKHTFIEKKY